MKVRNDLKLVIPSERRVRVYGLTGSSTYRTSCPVGWSSGSGLKLAFTSERHGRVYGAVSHTLDVCSPHSIALHVL